MAKEYLDKDGLLYFWQKIKNTFALVGHNHDSAYVSDVSYDNTNKKIQKTKNGTTTDVVTLATVATSGSYSDLSSTPTIPSAGTGSSYPAMDGTRALGSNDGYARVDHVHPTDTSRASSSHTHGNITNGGALQTTDVSIANGDKLVVTDSSNSNKVARTSTAFDGSTTTKALTQKGTFETFSQFSGSYNDLSDKPTIPTLKNVFGKVKVGSTTIEADTTQDTLELVAGSNVTLTPDATNDKVTIEATDTTYSDFSGTTHGLVPAISASGAFLCSDATWRRFRFYNVEGGSIVGGQSVTNSGYIDTTFYSATDSLSGLMSSTDKAKVDKLVFNGNEIDSSILPSYVDDVVEAYPRTGQTELSSTWLATGSASGTVITPETGKIYILMADSTSYAANTQFRWSGTTYVKLADGGVSEITNAEIDTIVAS